jgi:hypothetical protein
MLPLEYYDMTILCFGSFVGYCYNLDYRRIYDTGISAITDLSWGQILSFRWSGATEPGFSSATTFAFYGKALMWSIVMPLAGASN